MSQGRLIIRDSAANEQASISAFGLAELVRHIAVIGLSGALAGALAGGIGGRLLMRIAAVAAPEGAQGLLTENGNQIGEITLGGTIAIFVFLGILLGAMGAVAYVIAEPWLKWSARWCPVVFALFIMAIGTGTVIDPDNVDFQLVGSQGLVIAMFLALFLVYGVSLVWLVQILDRRLPGVNASDLVTSTLGYIVVLAFGLLVAPGFFFLLLSQDACGCEPRYLLGSFLMGMAALTTLLWIARHTIDSTSKWNTTIRLLGYGTLTGAVVSGAIGAWSDITHIL